MHGTWGEHTNETRAWSDPRVRAWIAEQGKAFYYDPERTTKGVVEELEQLHLGAAMYREGKLVDHDVRFESAEALLEWLKVTGEREMTREYAMKRAGEREAFRMWPRMVLAERLFRLGDERGADAELAWILGEQIREESARIAGPFDSPDVVKSSVNNWASPWFHWRSRGIAFIAKDSEAGKEFAALRKGLWEVAMAAPTDRFAQGRWVRASVILPDAGEVAAIVGEMEKQPEGTSKARDVVEALFRSLAGQGRWREAGLVLIDPKGLLERSEMTLGISGILAEHQEDPDFKRQWAEGMGAAREFFARESANLYTALLAAKRDEDAREVAEAAFNVWPSIECKRIVLERALQVGEAREHQLPWAEEIDQRRENMAGKVREKLVPGDGGEK